MNFPVLGSKRLTAKPLAQAMPSVPDAHSVLAAALDGAFLAGKIGVLIFVHFSGLRIEAPSLLSAEFGAAHTLPSAAGNAECTGGVS